MEDMSSGGKGFSIASMILGLASICCMCVSPLGIILGGFAINLAKNAITFAVDGWEFAAAGRIMGIVGLVGSVLINLIFGVVIVGWAVMSPN